MNKFIRIVFFILASNSFAAFTPAEWLDFQELAANILATNATRSSTLDRLRAMYNTLVGRARLAGVYSERAVVELLAQVDRHIRARANEIAFNQAAPPLMLNTGTGDPDEQSSLGAGSAGGHSCASSSRSKAATNKKQARNLLATVDVTTQEARNLLELDVILYDEQSELLLRVRDLINSGGQSNPNVEQTLKDYFRFLQRFQEEFLKQVKGKSLKGQDEDRRLRSYRDLILRARIMQMLIDRFQPQMIRALQGLLDRTHQEPGVVSFLNRHSAENSGASIPGPQAGTSLAQAIQAGNWDHVVATFSPEEIVAHYNETGETMPKELKEKLKQKYGVAVSGPKGNYKGPRNPPSGGAAGGNLGGGSVGLNGLPKESGARRNREEEKRHSSAANQGTGSSEQDALPRVAVMSDATNFAVQVEDNAGGGECLFLALGTTRRELVNQVENGDATQLDQILASEMNHAQNAAQVEDLDDWINQMRTRNPRWGGALEIALYAEINQVQVITFHLDPRNPTVWTQLTAVGNPTNGTILLGFTGTHYVRLHRLEDQRASIGAINAVTTLTRGAVAASLLLLGRLSGTTSKQ